MKEISNINDSTGRWMQENVAHVGKCWFAFLVLAFCFLCDFEPSKKVEVEISLYVCITAPLPLFVSLYVHLFEDLVKANLSNHAPEQDVF